MLHSFQCEIDGVVFSIASGELAKQSSGSVLVSCGGTVVLVTVVASKEQSEDSSFFPLSVEYQERFYSVGRIPGNYFRREIGRPSEKEVLTSRLIDRPLRPLFANGFNAETQVVATVLSMDKRYDADILAMIGASAALSISDIPFEGPLAAIRVAKVNGKLEISPSFEDCETADINLTVAGSKSGIVMVEGGANVQEEEEVLNAIFFAFEKMQPLIEIQHKLIDACGKEKRKIEALKLDENIKTKANVFSDKIKKALQNKVKETRKNAISLIKEEFINSLSDEEKLKNNDIKLIYSDLVYEVSRNLLLKEGKRIDGRAFNEIRQINTMVGVLPRPHGSALFTRGETQALAVLTLGAGRDEQNIETLAESNEKRKFMLHYNFPPFAVGETKRMGGPSRRDIGHGALSTRAIQYVLPPNDKFEYTIRIVSEILESNGSSSMATVCASSLALMDGGVPIKDSVAGIAMGLVQDSNKTIVLSDILGDEDHFGDMDFKVAGTKDGITSIQMDIKIKELTKAILSQALNQAKEGRLHILQEMAKTITVHRPKLSDYAPKLISVQINPSKIGAIIGTGGKVIKDIQARTNTILEIDEKGFVKILAENDDSLNAAVKIVKDIAFDPEAGEIYDGVVMNITDFGAFVKIKENTEGLVHISELADYRVKNVTDIVKEGDKIKVKVLEITQDGKIRLSYKAAKK